MEKRWNKSLMPGAFRNSHEKLYWSRNSRQLNERSGICMATARNRLEDAGLFAGRPLIGARVMIRILLGMLQVVENVMNLMGR